MARMWVGEPDPGKGETAAGYAEYIRSTTLHLRLAEARPVLGIRRWVVSSAAWPSFRPVIVWGSELRARVKAQRWHAAHARAINAAVEGIDADLAGTYRVRGEYRRMWADDPIGTEQLARGKGTP